MSAGIIADRYARALISLTDTGLERCQQVFQCFDAIVELFANQEALKVLKSPAMPDELKKDLLSYALNQSNADDLMRHFVFTVLDQGRVSCLPEIAASFRRMVREANGTYVARVTSAVAMDTQEQDVIGRELGSLLKKEIEVESFVDEDLLGGFIVQVGNSMLDLSLKSKLDELTSNVAL